MIIRKKNNKKAKSMQNSLKKHRALLLKHLANMGYTFAKVFGTEHELCANQFAPPMLGNFAFSISLAFGGATLVALKQNGNNERKMEV